ncbi:MAG: hypothetical protein QOH59_2443, partial [Gemmatimonadales bacterium]|nr:hypothetical protein [Gemmatimonadales bacterium]
MLRRPAAVAAGVLAAYLLGNTLLPRGLPLEAVIPGLILGGLGALTAMGLVLIYRSTRIINFAQANMGGIVATLVVLLVTIAHWNFWLACAAGLVGAVVLGSWIERAFIRRFVTAPRLILTVVTIGIAQLLAAGTLLLQSAFGASDRIGSIVPFKTPIAGGLNVGSVVLNGGSLLALGVVPLVLGGLVHFQSRTDAGIGARASADSMERAELLGIPVQRLGMLMWVIASVMSALGAILTASTQGFQSTLLPGPQTLVVPLAAAVVARFDSLPVAFGTSIAIGVLQQAIFWSYPQSSVVDLAIFGIILVALLLRRRAETRVGGEDLGGFVALSEPRPLPAQILKLPEIRSARIGGLAFGMFVCAVVPFFLDSTALTFFAFVSIFVILAASLVVLAGWGGQVSLGQFAFAGLGAGTTGWLLTSFHASLLVCLAASTLVGVVAALLIGLPALRIRGLYLAAVTLAFAVPASSFFLSSLHFPSFTPDLVTPPVLFGRFDLSSPRPFYYFCLIMALIAVGVARNFRQTRIGRAAVGARDNERMVEALSVSVTRIRLATFGVSGALAGLAGGLYVLAYRGVPFGGFAPVLGLEAFAMVVVGGMGSLWGAVLGALYIYLSQYFLGAAAQLVVAGGGIITVLQFAPGGLAQASHRLRDVFITRILRQHGLSPNLLYARPEEKEKEEASLDLWGRDRLTPVLANLRSRLKSASGRRHKRTSAPAPVDNAHLLTCEQVEGGYG